MRYLLGTAGGIALALVLFFLLALLVAPPEDERQVIEIPLSVSMVEAPAEQAPEQAAAPAEIPPPPPPAAAPPPPAPMPSPVIESEIAMPEPDLPEIQAPAVPQEMTLPELAEVKPQPKPTPRPEPRPEPEPAPEPEPMAEPSPQPRPAPTRSLADTGQTASPAPAATEEIVSPQPTRRVPPEYPRRALRRGIEGYVEVRFTIQPNGSVDEGSLRVVEARPSHVFERAAMRAIADWQFPEASSPREARQRLEFKLEG